MSTTGRRIGLGLLAALVLAATSILVWRVVSGDEVTDRVTVSTDGVRWTADLEDAFFYSPASWEPGEVRTAIVWVRNDADVRTDVDVAVMGTGGQELIRSGVIRASASVRDGDPQAFEPAAETHVVTVGELEPGERSTLTIRAEVVGVSPVDSASVRYRVAGSGVRAEPARSVLDTTGAHLWLAPVFLALALVLTARVMRSSRRS